MPTSMSSNFRKPTTSPVTVRLRDWIQTLFLVVILVVSILRNGFEVSRQITTQETLIQPSRTSFGMAYAHSLGFIDDVQDGEWELMRQIAIKAENNEHPDDPLRKHDKAHRWYQSNWDPNFSCRHERKIGMGDGAKVR